MESKKNSWENVAFRQDEIGAVAAPVPDSETAGAGTSGDWGYEGARNPIHKSHADNKSGVEREMCVCGVARLCRPTAAALLLEGACERKHRKG